jgi:hypothetical protein
MLLVPVWYCISPECQEALRAYQWRHHRRKLTLPSYLPELETLDEIDRLMREKPHKPMGERAR